MSTQTRTLQQNNINNIRTTRYWAVLTNGGETLDVIVFLSNYNNYVELITMITVKYLNCNQALSIDCTIVGKATEEEVNNYKKQHNKEQFTDELNKFMKGKTKTIGINPIMNTHFPC